MKVTIFHNVQRECRQCGKPVMSLGDDQWAHTHSGAGHIPASVSLVSFDGYKPGHAMVRVFETEVPDGQDPHAVAERMFEAFNIGGDEMALAYRARRLRSLSVGDVVVVGEIPLHVARAGFKLVEGKFNETWTGDYGSVPVPHCSYCHVTGDDTTLEPFNLAGNLACRDILACQDRVKAASARA